MVEILCKSRTGQSIQLRPVPLSHVTLGRDNFGLAPWALQKAADGNGLRLRYDVKAEKRVRKMRKAFAKLDQGDPLRHAIVDLAVAMDRARGEDATPGARGGTTLYKQRDGVVGDIMRRGDLPSRLQQRLTELVYSEDPLGILTPVAAQTAHEGATSYPAVAPYPGKGRGGR
jgi:hypothetical protein